MEELYSPVAFAGGFMVESDDYETLLSKTNFS
jgi:hypothetical protein